MCDVSIWSVCHRFWDYYTPKNVEYNFVSYKIAKSDPPELEVDINLKFLARTLG